MGSIKERRQHPRFDIRWPVTYWNDGLFGQGTVLNLSHIGCHLAGTMPVTEGMLLKLWISPPQKEEQLCVEEARVLWLREYEFGLEFRRLPASDRRWLMSFLDGAERRHSFRGSFEPPNQEEPVARPLALPIKY